MSKKSRVYERATELRRQGFSYPEISRKLCVSKSTLSIWLRSFPVVLERKQVKASEIFRTQGQRLHAARLRKIAIARDEASREIEALSLKELKIVGAILYWAEGTKDSKLESVAISNSDPELIRLALRWLREVCQIPDHKLRVQMHIHTDLDHDKCLAFWMHVTGLPREQFLKTQIKKSSLGHRKKISYNGTVQIRAWDRQIYRRIQGWIFGLQRQIDAPVAQQERAAGF